MRIWVVGTLLVVVGLSGCAGLRKFPAIRYYNIDGLSPTVETATRTWPVTLGVYVFGEATRYRDRMLYRFSDVEVGFYEYDRWVEPPGEMVTRVVIAHLRASGLFRQVTPALDASALAWVLSGEVLRFDEVRSASGSQAECRVQFELRRVRDKQLLWSDVITTTAALTAETPVALARAMSEAVQQGARRLITTLQQRVDIQP
jgi:ABC-type uncharacterized transport system auxiliary subunit